MSLIKKHTMTEKRIASNRRNQRLCHVPLTDEGKERIRGALRRFGYNAQAEEAAMGALGEDPAGFHELLEVLWEEWNPSGGMQEGVVISLARAMWLMNRAARMQEGCAVRQAAEVNAGRADRLHTQMMRLTMTEERLRRLAQSVACERYLTSKDDLEKMKNLHQDGVLNDMSEVALALFYELQAPGTDASGIDPIEKSRRALARFKEIFGLSSDVPPKPRPVINFNGNPNGLQTVGATEDNKAPEALPASKVPPTREANSHPSISEAEWEARERPRQLLENILTRQMEACAAQRKALLKETVKGPSPYERAAEIAPTHPNARLMRRMQDSNLKEVRRLTNLLLKIKRYERQKEDSEETHPFQDVSETKGVSGNRPNRLKSYVIETN
jgi:hypothetical protein